MVEGEVVARFALRKEKKKLDALEQGKEPELKNKKWTRFDNNKRYDLKLVSFQS